MISLQNNWLKGCHQYFKTTSRLKIILDLSDIFNFYIARIPGNVTQENFIIDRTNIDWIKGFH